MSPRSHRLSAIWFADIVDYTGLLSRDEYAAMRLVERLQAVARAVAEEHGGRIGRGVRFLGRA